MGNRMPKANPKTKGSGKVNSAGWPWVWAKHWVSGMTWGQNLIAMERTSEVTSPTPTRVSLQS